MDRPLDPRTRDELRLVALMALMAAGLLLLLANLWRIQVWHVEEFGQDAAVQSTRRLRVPAERGRLLGPGGEVWADNRPSIDLALDLAALRQSGKWGRTVDEVLRQLDDLRRLIGRPPSLTAAEIDRHIHSRLPMPLTAWRDLGPAELARVMENAATRRGLQIVVEPVRDYRYGPRAAQVLGFVGRAETATNTVDFQFTLPETEGRAGLEKHWNHELAGQSGVARLEVDVTGFRRGATVEEPPRAGADLRLTLDPRLQGLAEQALGDTPGAAVLLNPDTGDVLAMASAPGFDPNAFVPVMRRELWTSLNDDPAKPMMNRAMAEIYAPGSVFKPLVAIAALSSGRATPATAFDCPGYLAVGGLRIRCWNPAGHGHISLERGIEQSCNVYFGSLGLLAGWDAVAAVARGVGLGQTTGIDSDYDVPGLIPDAAWKRAHWHDTWRPADTAIASIGQGAVAVTPLQMAVVVAALANGGYRVKPRLVRGVQGPADAAPQWRRPAPACALGWPPAAVAAVREGMRGVIQSPTGTGRRARIAGIEMAGKTGTAEFGVKGGGRKHAWMICFAPFDRPRYALAMVVDEGESGGSTVAPRVRRLMQSVFSGAETLVADETHS